MSGKALGAGIVVGIVVGAGLALVMAPTAITAPHPATGEGAPAASPAPGGSPPQDLERRLDRVDRRLGELAETTARIEIAVTKLAGGLERTETAMSGLSAGGGQGAAAEAAAYKELSDTALMATVRRHVNQEPLRARAALRVLLARDLDADTRADATIQLAFTARGLGEKEEEEKLLRQAAEMVGENTETGLHALYQLAWTVQSRGNKQEAEELARRVAARPDVSPIIAVNGRMLLARAATNDGSRNAEAREHWQAVLDDFSDQTGRFWDNLRKQAKSALAGLE